MKGLRRLLLIPSLAPLLAVLVLSAANRGSSARLQLLIWRSPDWPLAAWTALAAVAGVSISGIAALLILPGRPPLQRTTYQRVAPSYQDPPRPDPTPTQPMPERDVRDPAPTIAVPYRVIQRPSASVRSDGSEPGPDQASKQTAARPESRDDWGWDPNQDW